MGLNKAGGGAAPASNSPATSNTFGSNIGNLGGFISSLGGIASGISKGGASGGLQAAGNAASLYNKVTGSSGGFSGLLGQAGSALNVYNGLTSGTPQGVVSGLASGAGLAASSGAASALGASSAAVGALGTAATGVGAVAAIPAVVQGVGGLIFNNLLGVNKPDKTGNELALLRNNTTSGVTERAASAAVSQGGFGAAAANKNDGVHDFYNGHDITVKIQDPVNAQKASDLFKSGNMAAYTQFMQSLYA